MYFIYRTWYFFIRTHTVYTAHENITEGSSIGSFLQKLQIDMESRIFLHANQIQGNDRNLGHACFFQSTTDKSDIVGGTTTTAGLRHYDSSTV